MNWSIIFKTAHAIAKATIKRARVKCDYRATFAASLKMAIEQLKSVALNFDFRDILGFNFSRTKSGKKVIVVKVGSFAQKLLEIAPYSVMIDGSGRIPTFAEVTRFGGEFESLESAVLEKGIKYQYVYFNEVAE